MIATLNQPAGNTMPAPVVPLKTVRPSKPEAEAVFRGMFDAALEIMEQGKPVSGEDLRRCGYSAAEIEQHRDRLFRHLQLALEARNAERETG